MDVVMIVAKMMAMAEETSDRNSKRHSKTNRQRRDDRPLWSLARSSHDRMKSCKQRGEWAELCFMARAAELGLCVCKPYGDSSPWDVGIVQAGRILYVKTQVPGARLLRVQVKSTTYSRDGSFTCNIVGPGHKPYPPGVLDYFGVYLVPLDLWYILPFDATEGNISLQFAPERQGHKLQRYLEAWHLLR